MRLSYRFLVMVSELSWVISLPFPPLRGFVRAILISTFDFGLDWAGQDRTSQDDGRLGDIGLYFRGRLGRCVFFLSLSAFGRE